MHAYKRACMCAFVHACMWVCAWVYMHVCVLKLECTCVCVNVLCYKDVIYQDEVYMKDGKVLLRKD